MSTTESHEVSLEDAFELAMKNMHFGNYRVAEMTFKDILASVPDHAQSMYYLGMAYYHMGNVNEALYHIKKSLDSEEADAEWWSNYGVILNENDRQSEAIEALEHAARMDKKNAMIQWNICYAHWLKGDYKNSEKAGRKAVKMAPESAEAWLNLGAALVKLDKKEEAKECWEKALELKPDFAFAWNNMGNLLRNMGDLQGAEEKCLKALELDPNYVEALNNLGNVYLDQRKLPEAEELYRAAVTRRPNYAEAHNNLCVCLMSQLRYEDAVIHGRYAVTFQPDYYEAHLNLSDALRSLGHLEEAQKAIQAAVVLQPDSAEVHMDLADLLLMQDSHADAEVELRKVKELKPDNPRVYIKLATVQERANKPVEALETIQKAVEENPEMPEAYVKRGQINMFNNNVEQAEKDYLKALELAPNTASIFTCLSDLYQTMGDLDKSRECLKEVKKLGAKAPGYYNSLSNVKKFTKKDQDFKDMVELEKHVESFGLEQSATLNFALYSAYENIGDYKKAFEHLKKGNDCKRKLIPHNTERQSEFYQSIKETYTEKYIKQFKGKGYNSKLPIFILGMPRSGTTLTEQIISSHPDVYGAGELTYLAELDNEFGPMTEKNCRDMGKRYVERLKKRDPSGKAKKITDKMPGNFSRIGQIVSILPQAKIIHCRRNPIDNCLSCYKQNFARGQYWSYNLEELAEFYKLYDDLMEHWASVLPDKFLTINYEETVSNFEEQARKLIDFVDLDWNDACLEPHKQKRAVLTASKMQVIKPVYKTSVKSWHKYGKELEPLIKGLGLNDELKEFKKKPKTQKDTKKTKTKKAETKKKSSKTTTNKKKK